MSHGLDTILKAAETMRDKPGIRFVFVGEGAEKENLIASAKARNLSNVQFISQQPKERVPGFYAACDVGIVVLRDTPLFQEVLPSKLFEYMAMERPVILGVAGEAKELVEKSGAGRFVEPENAQRIVEEVQWFMDHPDEVAQMGRTGRQFVIRHYDRNALAEEYLKILDRELSGKNEKQA
jgi:glycosyltransferase involved in cell wall biosynthesis